MGSLLGDPSVFDDKDHIRILERGDTLSDYEYRLIFEKLKILLNL